MIYKTQHNPSYCMLTFFTVQVWSQEGAKYPTARKVPCSRNLRFKHNTRENSWL